MSVGKIFFAWVDALEVFDPAIHAREDEQVFDLQISETEGDFATATITIENPKVGLLSPARKQRCFISAEITGSVKLLFTGRAVGIPASITDDIVELEFISRPDDHVARTQALLTELKTREEYHPALVAESNQNNATSVLEGFAGLIHFNRVTSEASFAPIAYDGSQTVIDLNGLFFQEGFEISFSDAPIRSVIVELDVAYEQKVPCLSKPYFRDSNGTYGGRFADDLFNLDSGRIFTMTPEDFITRFPKTGDDLGGGWSVLSAYLEKDIEQIFSVEVSSADAAPSDTTYTEPSYEIDFFEHGMIGNLVAEALYEQPRREIIRITIESDLQDIVVFPEPEEIYLTAEGSDIAPAVPFTISTNFKALAEDGDPEEFKTRFVNFTVNNAALTRPTLCDDLSISSDVITAAIARGKARLAKAARCVKANFDVPFDTATELSTKSVIRISDDRIPGGYMIGKISGLDMSVDGEGICIASIEISSSVGRSPAAVHPSIVSADCTAPFEPLAVSYSRNSGEDDGTFSISSARLRNGIRDQRAVLEDVEIPVEINRYAALGYRWAQKRDDTAALEALERALQEKSTELDFAFSSVEASDETVTDVTITLSSMFGICRDINLEAT